MANETTTDRAATIRQTLKGYGYSSRQVSVKSDYYSMGSSIRIRIKDATVPSLLVETIANEHEDISRDGFGEILSGGNRFVFVNYSSEAQKALAAPYLAAVEAALVKVHDNYLIDVDGLTDCRIGKNHYAISLWGKNGHIGEYYDAKDAAMKIGIMVANA